jgi:hypothetical protein
MRKHRIVFRIVLLAIVLGTGTAAYARPHGGGGGSTGKPEIDPSLAVTSLTMLAGTIATLRVRRKKQTK